MDDILDPEVCAGMLADMDRMMESTGCSLSEAAAHTAHIERLSTVELIYLKLAFEQRAAGAAN